MNSASKLASLKSAALACVDLLAAANPENRAGIIAFNSVIMQNIDFTTLNASGLSSIKSAINGLTAPADSRGGTNMQLALYTAEQRMIATGKAGSRPSIIFMGDGEPTLCYAGNLPGASGSVMGSGNLALAEVIGMNTMVLNTVNQAAQTKRNIQAKFGPMLFYTIGIGVPAEGRYSLNPSGNTGSIKANQYLFRSITYVSEYSDGTGAIYAIGHTTFNASTGVNAYTVGFGAYSTEQALRNAAGGTNYFPYGIGYAMAYYPYILVGSDTNSSTTSDSTQKSAYAYRRVSASYLNSAAPWRRLYNASLNGGYYGTISRASDYTYNTQYWDVTSTTAGNIMSAFTTATNQIIQDLPPLSTNPVVLTDTLGVEYIIDRPSSYSTDAAYLQSLAPAGTTVTVSGKTITWSIPYTLLPLRASETYKTWANSQNPKVTVPADPPPIKLSFPVKLNPNSTTVTTGVAYNTNNGANVKFTPKSGNPKYNPATQQTITLSQNGWVKLGYNKVTVTKVLKDKDGAVIAPAADAVFTVELQQSGSMIYTFTLNKENNWSESLENTTTGTYDVVETGEGDLSGYDISYSPSIITVTDADYDVTVTVTNKEKATGPPGDPEPEIEIVKEVDNAGPVAPNTTVNYTLTVENTGDENLKNVTITDDWLRGTVSNLTVTDRKSVV
jgi:hypothetical protein